MVQQVEKPRTPPTHSPTHHIEIILHDINQLFNTLDPSPFYEKDLDADAEEFIVNWAREFPLHERVVLDVYLTHNLDPAKPEHVIEQAVQNYFAYRGKLSRMEFRRLLREARLSLFIGVAFLVVCLTGAQLLTKLPLGTFQYASHEGLVICGWVAMWRPLQLYLYDWWPLRRRWKIYEKLSEMKVIVHRS